VGSESVTFLDGALLTYMKTATHMAAQGDVLFRRIDALPENANRVYRDGPLVVAHSETGHHHVIRSPDAELFSAKNPLISFLRIDGTFVDVEHLRDFDTHETLRLLGNETGPTYFEVRRQREHTFDNWQLVND